MNSLILLLDTSVHFPCWWYSLDRWKHSSHAWPEIVWVKGFLSTLMLCILAGGSIFSLDAGLKTYPWCSSGKPMSKQTKTIHFILNTTKGMRIIVLLSFTECFNMQLHLILAFHFPIAFPVNDHTDSNSILKGEPDPFSRWRGVCRVYWYFSALKISTALHDHICPQQFLCSVCALCHCQVPKATAFEICRGAHQCKPP